MGAYLHVFLYTMCVPSDHKGQKRVLYHIEPEVQTVVSW